MGVERTGKVTVGQRVEKPARRTGRAFLERLRDLVPSSIHMVFIKNGFQCAE
jgi:hypothetical protein